jgi:hypothetical protein
MTGTFTVNRTQFAITRVMTRRASHGRRACRCQGCTVSWPTTAVPTSVGAFGFTCGVNLVHGTLDVEPADELEPGRPDGQPVRTR